MALAAVEDLRYLQAGLYPGRESFLLPVRPEKQAFAPNPYLDALNPNLKRIPEKLMPETLDISIIRPNMLMILYLSDHPEARRALGKERFGALEDGGLIFSRYNEDGDPIGGGNTFVEVGQNNYFEPVDEKIYPGPYVSGSFEKVEALGGDLTDMDREGKDSLNSLHDHPENLLTFPSIEDNESALAMRANGKPFLNGFTIVGRRFQVTAQRTAESLLFPPHIARQKRIEWRLLHDAAGIIAGEDFERNDRRLLGEKRRKAKAAYVQAAQDEVVVDFAEYTRWKYYLSDDMATAHALPPRKIMTILREELSLAA